MSSPPKPWETAGGQSVQPQTSATTTAAPEVPARPNSMQNTNQYGSGYGMGTGYNSGYGSAYGSGMYSGGMYGGGYGSAYGTGLYGNRMGLGGMYGASSYGAYGMGSPYGGGMYGNRMGMGNVRLGPNGLPIEENMSFMQQMELSTQSTFQVLDQIVQAFAGFSQMLESTFFATHSSFMAMMGVADQFGQLKGYLSQVFSIVSLYKTVKNYMYLLTGNTPPVDPSEISVKAFEDSSKPKPSKRPLIVFLAMVIGLPYLFSKLFQYLEKNRKVIAQSPSDIRNLEFCKANYDFVSNNPQDLPFKAGDLIAVLSKLEPESEWWRGRTQEGRVGMFPKNYVSLIPKRDPVGGPVALPGALPPQTDDIKSDKGLNGADLEGSFNKK